MNTNESTVSTGATYTTQMDAARKGIITPEMKIVAQKEKMTEEELRVLVACGKVVIPANKNHKSLDPEGVGSMLRTKINVNLGVSRDCKDYNVEMKKVMAAVDLGAESIMDLSSHGNTQPFRQKLTAECPAMIGTVPVYDSVIQGSLDRLNPILMTALSSALALNPLALDGDLPGNEIQSPMAKVILGGLLTSTFLNGFIIPIVYLMMNGKRK